MGLQAKEKDMKDPIKKEIKKKKDIAEASIEVVRKKAKKREQMETNMIKEREAKKVKEAGKKSIIRRTERGVKTAEKAAAVEREAKQRAISATEKRKKREADEAERQKEYERDAAKKIKADQAKAEEIGLAKVKAAALNAVAKKGLFNLKKEAKQMEVRAKERDKKKLEDAQEGIAKKKRVIKAAAKRAAENLSKQLLKKAMDKKRPERERGMKEFKADEKTKKMVKVNSEKNAKATEKKNTVKLDKKEKQFEQDKIAARAKIKKADAYAKEVASKAEPTSDSIKARAGAKGRIETAAAAERAVKYKEKNKKWMRKRYRVVWTKIRADVSAYVDSGPNKLGTDEVALREAELAARGLKIKAAEAYKKNNYAKAEKTYKADIRAADKASEVANKKNDQEYHKKLHNWRYEQPGKGSGTGQMQNAKLKPTVNGNPGNKGQNFDKIKKQKDAMQKNAIAKQRATQQAAASALNKKKGGRRLLTAASTELELADAAAPTAAQKKAAAAKKRADLAKQKAKKTGAAANKAAKKAGGKPAAKKEPDPTDHKMNQLQHTCNVARNHRHHTSHQTIHHRRRKGHAKYEKTQKDEKKKCDIANKYRNRLNAFKAKERAKKHQAEQKQKAEERKKKEIANKKAEKERKVKEKKSKEVSAKERRKKAAREKMEKEARKTLDRIRAQIAKTRQEKHLRYRKILAVAEKERNFLQSRLTNTTNVYNSARSKHTAVMQLPANKPWGKLPQYAAHQGFLRIQSGFKHEQSAFIKFPTKILRKKDVIVGGRLRLFKYGGYGGPAIVKVTSCQWSRGTITYTRSLGLGGTRVSTGITARFPDGLGRRRRAIRRRRYSYRRRRRWSRRRRRAAEEMLKEEVSLAQVAQGTDASARRRRGHRRRRRYRRRRHTNYRRRRTRRRRHTNYRRRRRRGLANHTHGVWVEIKLKGDALEAARVTGNHLCLDVEGGPTQTATIISSELTRQAPELKLQVRVSTTPMKYPGPKKAPKKKKVSDDLSAYRLKLKKELTEKYTNKQLARNRKEAKQKASKIQGRNGTNRAEKAAATAARIQNQAAQQANAQVAAQAKAINAQEQAKINAATQNARGADKIALQAQMQQQSKVDVAKKIAKAKDNAKVAAQATAAAAQARAAKKDAKAAAAADKKESKALKKGGKLTPAQEARVTSRVNIELPKRMAAYRKAKAGGKPPPTGKAERRRRAARRRRRAVELGEASQSKTSVLMLDEMDLDDELL